MSLKQFKDTTISAKECKYFNFLLSQITCC